MKNIVIVEHPLVQHKLTLMRQKETKTPQFRTLMREVSLLLGYEATRTLSLSKTPIETPMEESEGALLKSQKPVF